MDIEQILAEQDNKEMQDLISVALPRSTWMLVASLVMVPIIQDLREIKDAPEWGKDQKMDEIEEALGEPITKVIPVLLEAVGPGPQNMGDFPDVQILRQNAEMIWEMYGEGPSDEHWGMARQCVTNLFQLLREQGVDPENLDEFELHAEES